MNSRIVFRATLSVVLLILAGGPGLARGPQPTGPSEAVGVNASPAANAPWLMSQVDTAGNTGQYASVAIEKPAGTTHVSYYDVTYGDLRWARSVHSGGNCGSNNDWHCRTLDSADDVGKYSSIAYNEDDEKVGIAYYDDTNGHLNYAWAWTNPAWSWNHVIIDKGISGGPPLAYTPPWTLMADRELPTILTTPSVPMP